MNNYLRLTIPIVLYGLVCFVMMVWNASLLYAVMFWNVFLAALPLIFILKARKSFCVGKKVGGAVLSLLWLLFFPNAVYMATDMIHITGNEYFQTLGQYGGGVLYTQDIVIWCQLIVVACGIILSMLLGLESMRLGYGMAAKKSAPAAIFGSVAVSFLGGVGVYIGRFLRLNSWDVLRPFSLIKRILSSVDVFAVSFSLCYGLFVLIAFLFYFLLVQSIKNTERGENF